MNRDELVKIVQELDMDQAIEAQLIDIINKDPDLSPETLDKVADIIQLMGEIEKEKGEILAEEAKIYTDLADDLEKTDKDNQEGLERIFEETRHKLEEIRSMLLSKTLKAERKRD